MVVDSDPKRVKGVLQAMIDGIRVDARDQIEPTFRAPAVRIESGYMEPTGIEPVTSCLQSRGGHAGASRYGGFGSPETAL